MDEATLEQDVFPRLARELIEAGEVYVDYDYASHFAHWLMREQHVLWQRAEQEVLITEHLQARFYLND